MLLIKNGRIVTHREIFHANILVDRGKITQITKAEPKADVVINADGKLIIPGVVDPHVHFRQPGLKSEDWNSGSKSAIAGGVTTVLDMPNTNPPTTTLSRLLEKKALIERTNPPLVNYGLHFGAKEDNLDEIEKVVGKTPLAASVKIFMAKSNESLLIKDVNLIGEIIRRARIVCVHAEDEEVIE
ncbi:MAG: amidohydrolase family protein, partial [Candidatus Methanomethyliaceae archaeon]|nr:amidohydrolase family protein [Candidatus Methanomethyliaceae archaeon]